MSVAIEVKNVNKTFKLPHEKQSSVKGAFVNIFNGKRTYERQQVLKDVSFEVKDGEFFGIVGRNGSGKSTLLKMLAGIYEPNGGHIKVNGKLTPFIELGVGFNPNLTGRENVYLNGALLGFNRKEMDAMYDDIVSFAEIGRFMDQKLKNYSSGMQVRLAFSIAIRAQSDILLFDEVLAVGDAAFQQKCYDMFENMSAAGRTIVLVTHDMSAVQRFCNRAILIEKGVIEMMGNPSEIADRYLEQNFEGSSHLSGKKETVKAKEIHLKNVSLRSDRGEQKNFSLREKINLNFQVINESSDKDLRIGFQVFDSTGVYCFGTNTKLSDAPVLSGKTANVNMELDQTLTPGTYHITLAIMNNKASKVLAYLPRVATFNIKQETEVQGVALMDTKWEIKNV